MKRITPSYRFDADQGDSVRTKALYSLLGASVALSVQFGYVWWRRRSRGASSFGGNGDVSAAKLNSRVTSPLHHLDLQKLKARSTASASLLRQPGQGDAPIFQVVLTGGPSGGKSRLDRVLREDHGFDVYLCPEVPTLLLNAGARYPGRPSVILFDRGLLDFAAYTPAEKWGLIMNHNQWICDGVLNCATKYDLVLHMESAAVGAEEHLPGREGIATKEELDEAKSLDKKILTCWRGHPHHRVVDNSTDFEGNYCVLVYASIEEVKKAR